MIAVDDLRLIALARLEDAKALFAASRIDGAAYVCGYAVEIALKARICITLGWQGFPDTRREFESYTTFRTHNLDVLLSLTGREIDVKENYLGAWSAVAEWNPEARYKAVGEASAEDIEVMIAATEKLMTIL